MRIFSRRRAAPPGPVTPTIEAIFRAELKFIVGTLLHFGIAPLDVEDAAHEVIRAVLRGLSTFDPSRDLRSWLFGVTFNVASNHLRRAARHRARFLDEPADVTIPDLSATIEDRMIQEETFRTVREVLAGIELARRAVIIARVVHGMSELETAEALSIPIGTVKTRLRIAKQELRDGIQRREREEAREPQGAFLLPLGVLLGNEAKLPEVPAAMRARLWEQLQHMITQHTAPMPANDSAGPAVSPSPSPLRRLLDPDVGRVLVGALVGGALVFALGPIDHPPAVLPTREALTALGSVPLATVPSTSVTASAAPTASASAPRPARTSAPAEVVSAAAELADPPASADLLASATVALERHDTATARKLLEQQAHDFPRSKFGMSRDLLWVRVLLSEGKRAEAKAKADALRKIAPQNPMVKNLDTLFPSEEPSP